MGDPSGEEIGTRKAPQPLPEEIEARFDPLATCPESERKRWKRRAAFAATQPMRAIELKCLECCAWYRPEVSRCDITGCPLWAANRRIFGR